MIPILDLAAQYRSLKEEIDAAVLSTLASAKYILGPEVEAFEREFAAYCGVRHCIAVNSGTSALHLALVALGVGPGDDVVTVSHTFVATVAAIRYTGARPILVDVNEADATMAPELLENAITTQTRVIVPVHLYGQCAAMDSICEIARRHDIPIIEDAAQAHGARYRGRRAGSIGLAGCFSFYPGKNLGAYGEGGAICTNDAALAGDLRLLRDHGAQHKYQHERVGYNYRMEGLQGAVLRVKLRRLEGWTERRRYIAKLYRSLLEGGPVALGSVSSDCEAAYHIFPIYTPQRDALRERLMGEGIETGVHYPIPVHLQPGYADGVSIGPGLPVTEKLARTCLSLPIYPELRDEAVRIVAARVIQASVQARG